MTEQVWVGQACAGPLLLVPESLLPDWSGIDVPEYRIVTAKFRWKAEESRACDYDRACDVDDEAGVISVGHGEGLVIGGSLQATTWLPRLWGGLVARWEYAENENSMQDALTRIPASLAYEPHGEFNVGSSPLNLFNSAEPGDEIVMPRLSIELAPGQYDVGWARYTPDDVTSVGLIQLRRAHT